MSMVLFMRIEVCLFDRRFLYRVGRDGVGGLEWG